MNRQPKKIISFLLLLTLLCTLAGMAAAEGEEQTGPDGSEITIVVPSGGGNTDTSSTDEGSGAATGGESDSTSTADPVVIIGPGTENQIVSDGPVSTETEANPTAADTATPDPSPTPDPTPTQAAPVNTAKPTVTKSPTDETVDPGGECIFSADYSNAIWAVWHFVSEDGKTDYRFDDKALETAFPGLIVENGMYSTMTLKNIPTELNGWRVCCEYRNNNGSVRTGYATVTVRGAETAAAEPEPSPEPTPEATPEPTPEPTPEATPEPTPTPAPSPEESPKPTPKLTVKPGGNHVILKLALGFGIAAVVLCGGIWLIFGRRE